MSREISLEARNEKIKKEYERLSSEKKHGVEMYTHEYICNQLAFDFYLTPNRIHTIVTGYIPKKMPKAIYKAKKQTPPSAGNSTSQTSLFNS